MEKINPPEQENMRKDTREPSVESSERLRGDRRPSGLKKVESKVKLLFSMYSSGKKKAQRSKKNEDILSQIDYKLAQRLDSAGSENLAKEIPGLTEKGPGLFSKLTVGFRERSFGNRLAMGVGGLASVIVLFLFVAFGLIWYRGTDVPILRNLSEQSQPVLAMDKQVETEYGVGTDDNWFTISPEKGITFRSLGIGNKVAIVPEVDFEVELTGDHGALQIVPAENLEADTEYSVIVREGTMFSDGSSLSEDSVWVFRTEPIFMVTGITPRDGSDSAPVDTAIEIEFTYKDVDAERFEEYFSIEPPVNGRFERHGKKIVFLPAKDLVGGTVYEITVKEGFFNSRGDSLEREYTSKFRISNLDSSDNYIEQPTMYWSEISPIISTTQEPWIGITASYVTGSINFTLYEATTDAIVDSMKDYEWDLFESPDPTQLTKIRDFSLSTLEARFFNVNIDDYGIYLLRASNASYGRSIFRYLVYTPVGIVTSGSQGSDKVWLSDMNEKEPLGSGKVYFYDFDASDIPVHSDTTDSNGYAAMDDGGSELIIVNYLDKYAVSLSGSYANSSMWWFNPWASRYETDTTYRSFIYTDRPLYRPGDVARFKVIAREEDDMSYGVPGGKDMIVRVGSSDYLWNGYRDLPIYEETLIVSREFGTATGEFDIPANAIAGYHTIEVVIDGSVVGSASFTVAEFQKPRYTFEMTLNKTRAFSGDSVQVEVMGTDYSGDPAAGARVGLSASRSEVTAGNWLDSSDELNREQMYYIGSDGVASPTLTLDGSGRATYDVPVDVSSYGTKLGVYSVYIWSQEDYVNHDSESVIVADSDVALFVKPDEWSVTEGGENELTFKTVGLWDFSEEAGTTVEYDVEREWTEWVETGDYYDPATKSTKPIHSSVSHSEYVIEDQEITLGSDGFGKVELADLLHGSYTIHATYGDGGSSARVLNDVFYVFEEPEEGAYIYSDWEYASDKFKIYTDKEEYEIGDTATVTVKTTLGGKGIYMATRGDVYEWRVMDFSSGVVTLQHEITDNMSPWINICAWGIDEYVSSDAPQEGVSERYLSNVHTNLCQQVSVSQDQGMLDVEIFSDKATYEPGDTVSLDVRVSDSSGKGVSAEVSVDVVDRALLDIVRGSDEFSYDIYKGFYEDVRQLAHQRGSAFKYGYYGFGGGGAGGGGDEVRSNFADVAYWNGSMRTDGSGRAEVEFTLPDNLTTWSVLAVAVSTDTWVGESSLDIISRKEVKIDANVPNFLRSDDAWEMDVELVNSLSDTVNAELSVECADCVDTIFRKNVQLGAGRRATYDVGIKPVEGAESLSIIASLAAGREIYDAIEWVVPVIPEGFISNETVSALLSDGEDEGQLGFSLPSSVDVDSTKFQISTSRSFINEWALVPIDPSISSSVELASSIIHNSVFCKYYDEIKPSEPKEVYERRIESALDLLNTNQAEDGGYGWFDYDVVSYEVSAYVGIAMGRAQEVGLISEIVHMGNLQMYLWDGMESEITSTDEKALAVYSLAVMGDSSVLPYAIALKNDPGEISNSPLNVAHVMLALQELGSVSDAGELTPQLEATANYSQRAVTWTDEDVPFRVLRSTEYTTATVYQALAPYEYLELTELARTWLVENPVTVYGISQDAVGIFYALAVSDIGNLEGRMDVNKVTLKVNGQEVRTFDVGGNKDWNGRVDLLVDSRYLRNGENMVEITRSGEGELYVINNVSYYSPQTDSSQEFVVDRAIRDFETGRPVESVKKGQVVTIETKVKSDRDGYNLVVNDFMPAGFEPVQYQLGDYDYEFFNKWWKWGMGGYVNRYGTVAQDHVSFTEYKIKGGKVYEFEFPAVATYTGSFSGAGSQGYLLGFGDIGGYDTSSEISIIE